MKLHQFTLVHFLNEYQQNREVIEAYLKGDTIEGFNDIIKATNAHNIEGLTVGTFIAIFAFILAIWIWALVVTIQFWHFIPVWAKVLALVGLLTGVGGPVLTLIVVYASKSNKKIKG